MYTETINISPCQNIKTLRNLTPINFSPVWWFGNLAFWRFWCWLATITSKIFKTASKLFRKPLFTLFQVNISIRMFETQLQPSHDLKIGQNPLFFQRYQHVGYQLKKITAPYLGKWTGWPILTVQLAGLFCQRHYQPGLILKV